jgi:hypothetical protein
VTFAAPWLTYNPAPHGLSVAVNQTRDAVPHNCMMQPIAPG